MKLRKSVERFAVVMNKRLDENSHKRNWREHNETYLLNCLRDEVDELRDALNYEPGTNILEEAADVANFAMMIANNLGDLKKVPA